MGEISEDMLDGTCCNLCGQYFADDEGELFTHGYPVTCWDCWKDLTLAEREGMAKADVDTM